MPNLFFGGFRERGVPFLLIHVSGGMKGFRSVSADILKRTHYLPSLTDLLMSAVSPVSSTYAW